MQNGPLIRGQDLQPLYKTQQHAQFYSKVAVVTGAGSGIGKHVALQLAEAGCSIAICDINPQKLDETAASIRQLGREVLTHTFDVAKRDQMYDFAKLVENKFQRADIVVNNAGVALGKVSGADVSYEDFEWIMGINFWGMVYGSKAFLSMLMRQEEACLVNVSSVLGLIGIPFQVPYCTTKFAIRGFTEALRSEMLLEHPHVNVLTVHPGGIRTSIAENSKIPDNTDPAIHAAESVHFERFFKTSAEDAAKVIIRAIRRKKKRVLIGSDAKIPDFMARLLPQKYSSLVARQFAKLIKKFGQPQPEDQS